MLSRLRTNLGARVYTSKRFGSAAAISQYVNGPGKKQSPLFHTAPLFSVYAANDVAQHALLLRARTEYYASGPDGIRVKGDYRRRQRDRAARSCRPFALWRVQRPRTAYPRQLRHSVPSIEQVYTEASAPGLTSQPAFFEPGIGIRMQPVLFTEHLRLHYFAEFQDFSSLGNQHTTFAAGPRISVTSFRSTPRFI